MDLLLNAEDLAFRDEVRRFLRDNVPPDMRRAIDLTTAFIVEGDVLIDFHRGFDAANNRYIYSPDATFGRKNSETNFGGTLPQFQVQFGARYRF